MARRGQPSTAHEYEANGACVHCGMYKNNVDTMNHACKPWRELVVDEAAAAAAGMDLDMYRFGATDTVGEFGDAEVEDKDDPTGSEIRNGH